jgi:hypothetical protein
MKMDFKLPIIPGDKANHFIYGLIIFAVCNLVLGALFSSIICIIVAGSKEVYDNYHPNHEASWLDVLWTLLGSITAAILIFLL